MMARMDGPLSAKFYEERPFLRPVIFVASTATPFLFQEEEEIFQPVVEEVGTDIPSYLMFSFLGFIDAMHN